MHAVHSLDKIGDMQIMLLKGDASVRIRTAVEGSSLGRGQAL